MFGFDRITEEYIAERRAGRANSHLNNPRVDVNDVAINGVFEDNKLFIRTLWVDGINYLVANKAWVDSGSDDGFGFTLPPWGSFPAMPKSSRRQ